LDGLYTGDDAGDKLVVDVFLNQHPRGAGADFALVEGKHHRAFNGFIKEVVVGIHYALEEHVGRLATQFHRHRNQ
nr:hypothetical protein [Tanacetum cinerariifolium]